MPRSVGLGNGESGGVISIRCRFRKLGLGPRESLLCPNQCGVCLKQMLPGRK